MEKIIADLKITLNNVLHEKKLQEEDFAQKRAKFKEMFLQREDELLKEATTVREERNRLDEELLGLKAAAAVIESTKQEEIEDMKRKCDEEVASLQKVMDDATTVASEETARAYQVERMRLLALMETMTQELEELRSQDRKPDARNRFSGFRRTIRDVASRGGPLSPAKEDKVAVENKIEQENLEKSMELAQQHAEMMKSVVVPLEDELKLVKEKNEKVLEENRLLHNKVEKLQAKVEDFQRSKDPAEEVKEVISLLDTEKSCRADLELFVGVLQTKKDVAEENADKFEKDLKNVCEILEKEKSKLGALTQTWQMANDQFLESQRLQMMDMRRLESVLTEEQQRQVEVLKKEDQQREEQERRVRDLEEKRNKLDQEVEQDLRTELKEESQPIQIPSPTQPPSPGQVTFHSTTNNITSPAPNINPDELAKYKGAPMSTVVFGELDSSFDPTRISDIDTSMFGEEPDGVAAEFADTQSITSNRSLTGADIKAIIGTTPEREQMDQVIENVTSSLDDHPDLTGKRVVSELEWSKLQEEKVDTEQDKFLHEQKQRQELEESLKNAAEDAQSQITILGQKNMESEEILTKLQVEYNQLFAGVHDQVMKLSKVRDEFYEEVKLLQSENDSLTNKRNIHSSIMNDEAFQIPNDMETLHSLCVKYREDMVTLRVNSEHELEDARAKLNFLQGQLQTEQHTRTALEETYQVELEENRQELLRIRSIKDEYEREKKLREKLQASLKTTEEVRKNQEIQSEEEFVDLKAKLTETIQEKERLEKELQDFKKRSSTLHADLKTSETVQMDFVKLSQSLQVQLENIRQTENEVRWEHEDDVDKCFNCKINFGSQRKKKVHCKHCGKIHCPECLSKTVDSGRSNRKMPVCDVCHTLLNKESAPYFSQSPPQTT
ncbi:putative rab GTPase-binding effector protein 1 [Apostichopus japonicus]|uniref:Putative rab GTPase-binding effector protein 1 n=1 Tax=Stichopus japonicus TaxID=307972 RepID=A0A2G8L8A6_STIJA|nr:putative rab GTPase-binding effector protein 1 [Apostichopus japonicus]